MAATDGQSFSVQLQRFDRKGKRVAGKIKGPDGQSLLKIYGPHLLANPAPN